MKVRNNDELTVAFSPLIKFIEGLSDYISILLLVTKSSYSGNFYILDSKGKRIVNTILEEDGRIDGNDWDKAVEQTVKSLKRVENAYNKDQLNVYTVTINKEDINISIQYLDNTGKAQNDARKKWLFG